VKKLRSEQLQNASFHTSLLEVDKAKYTVSTDVVLTENLLKKVLQKPLILMVVNLTGMHS
jgi:hypothetical protein